MRIDEVVKQISEDEINNIITSIRRDCQPFIQQSDRERPLYRGIQVDAEIRNQPFSKFSVHIKRNPLTMGKGLYNIINKGFKFGGFKARRDNSIFCTANQDTAQNYGTPFIVFPIGNFSFTWSPIIKDMYTTSRWSEIFQDVYDASNTNNGWFALRKMQPDWPLYKDMIKHADYNKLGNNLRYFYKDTDLREASDRSTEIMISCKEYYAIYIYYRGLLHDNLQQILDGVYA